MLVKVQRMKLGNPHIIYMMVTISTVPILLRYRHDDIVSRGVTIWLGRLQRNTNTKTNFKFIRNITPIVITEYNLCRSISPIVTKKGKTPNLCVLQHVVSLACLKKALLVKSEMNTL